MIKRIGRILKGLAYALLLTDILVLLRVHPNIFQIAQALILATALLVLALAMVIRSPRRQHATTLRGLFKVLEEAPRPDPGFADDLEKILRESRE